MDALPNPKYSFKHPRRQLFVFPPDMISSMLENPSSHKGLLKLYQTCKYFYSKRPILIANSLTYRTVIMKKSSSSDKFEMTIARRDVSHLRIPVWLTYSATFSKHFDRTNFFRCSSEELWLIDCTLQFDDFVWLTSEKTVKYFGIINSHVCHQNGTIATIDEILQNLPNIERFRYVLDERCSSKMFRKLNAMKFNCKFLSFTFDIEDVHPTFDLNLFCEFIMKNSIDDTELLFLFDEETKEKLKLAHDKLDSKWKNVKNPLLKRIFNDINPTSQWLMKKRMT